MQRDSGASFLVPDADNRSCSLWDWSIRNPVSTEIMLESKMPITAPRIPHARHAGTPTNTHTRLEPKYTAATLAGDRMARIVMVGPIAAPDKIEDSATIGTRRTTCWQ